MRYKSFSLVAVPFSAGHLGRSRGSSKNQEINFFDRLYFCGHCGALLCWRVLEVYVGVFWTRYQHEGQMDSIVFAHKRQRSLLEQVLFLAVGGLDMLEAGRQDDAERILLLRAKRMREFLMAEANVAAKMSGIENDL